MTSLSLPKQFGTVILIAKEIRRLRFGVRQCPSAFGSGERVETAATLSGSILGFLSKASQQCRTPKRGRGFKRKMFAEASEISIFVT